MAKFNFKYKFSKQKLNETQDVNSNYKKNDEMHATCNRNKF